MDLKITCLPKAFDFLFCTYYTYKFYLLYELEIVGKKKTKIHLSLTEKISANFQNLQGWI